MKHPLAAYLQLVTYAAPLLVVLSWLAYRHDISWTIAQKCTLGLVGLGLGIFVSCKWRGLL